MKWTKIDKDVKIYDNIYGFISLNVIEANILQHPLFQRLKNIKQLGFAYFVYPGATYTRFAHSIGVFELCNRFLSSLKTNSGESISKDDEKNLRMAALLHDIGHYPFSHVMEKFFGLNHELNGKHVIESSDIKEYLQSNGYNVDDICSIITGEYTGKKKNDMFMRQILNSDLDVDRLDYLLRDSYYAGIPYGRIDLENITRNISIDDGELVIERKSIRSVDHFLNARMAMYDSVYTHKTSLAFDLMFNQLITNLKEENAEDFDIKLPNKFEDLEGFKFLDDNSVLARIYKFYESASKMAPKPPSIQKILPLCEAFLFRIPYKLIFEKSSFLAREKADRIKDAGTSKKRAESIRRFSIELEDWLAKNIDCSFTILYKKGKPVNFSKGFPAIALSSDPGCEKWKYEAIRVINEDGSKSFIHEETNSILFFLSGYELYTIRVFYIKDEKNEEIESMWKKYIAQEAS